MVITNDLQWSKGIPGVIQECRIKLLMFKGEWFLDREVGISWWEQILGQKPDVAIAAITSEFFDKLMSVEDVLVVRQLDVEYNGTTRTISVTWSVKCTFGNTPTQTLPITL